MTSGLQARISNRSKMPFDLGAGKADAVHKLDGECCFDYGGATIKNRLPPVALGLSRAQGFLTGFDTWLVAVN